MPAPLDPISDDTVVFARVRYKGNAFLVIGRTKDRYRLTTPTGKPDLWARIAECEVLTEFKIEKPTPGRGLAGQTKTSYPKFRSFRYGGY